MFFLMQPGALSVIKAMANEVDSNNVDSVFHIGDISYATGFLVEWDYFLHLITPVATRVSYMTAIGNHERYFVNCVYMFMSNKISHCLNWFDKPVNVYISPLHIVTEFLSELLDLIFSLKNCLLLFWFLVPITGMVRLVLESVAF